jgi:hypothetical protein
MQNQTKTRGNIEKKLIRLTIQYLLESFSINLIVNEGSELRMTKDLEQPWLEFCKNSLAIDCETV